MPTQKVRVAILDDHQSVVDGYYYRLEKQPEIEIAGAVGYGEELEGLLARGPVDVLILDVSAPTARENRNPYPILHLAPKLLERHAALSILVISMVDDRALIQALLDAGISGYILKEDMAAIQQLAAIVQAVAAGGVYFSEQAFQRLRNDAPGADPPPLTPRQAEAISLSAAYPGEPLSALSGMLHISESTLRNLLHNAYARLGAHNRGEATLKARELGLITPLLPTGSRRPTPPEYGGQ